jgi:hypothetical protein
MLEVERCDDESDDFRGLNAAIYKIVIKGKRNSDQFKRKTKGTGVKLRCK